LALGITLKNAFYNFARRIKRSVLKRRHLISPR
jgi:hypothetical protein